MKRFLTITGVLLLSSTIPKANDTPPKPRPSHWCAAACVGPCLDGKPCICDGRTCLVDLNVPGSGLVRLRVENEGLPARKTPCLDRPLSQGKTFRRDSGITDFTIWVCNDPDCPFHRGDNGEFRGQP